MTHHLAVFKIKSYAICGLSTSVCSLKGTGHEIIPRVVYLVPPALDFVVYCVVQLAVHFEQTGAGVVGLVAGLADELAVYEAVAVTGRLDSLAPLNHAVARLAICLSVKAGSGTRCRDIRRRSCGMNVRRGLALHCKLGVACNVCTVCLEISRASVAVMLGYNVDLLLREGSGSTVCVFCDDGLRCQLNAYKAVAVGHPHCRGVSDGLVLVSVRDIVLEFRIQVSLCLPYADGKCGEHCLSGECGLIRYRERDACGVGERINGIRHLHAVSEACSLELPLVERIKVYLQLNGLDALGILCHNVEILDRARERLNVRCRSANDCDVSVIGIYCHLSGRKADVSAVILDLEAEGMSSVCESDIGKRDNAVAVASVELA